MHIAFWTVFILSSVLAVHRADANDAASDTVCQAEAELCEWKIDADVVENDQQPHVTEVDSTSAMQDAVAKNHADSEADSEADSNSSDDITAQQFGEIPPSSAPNPVAAAPGSGTAPSTAAGASNGEGHPVAQSENAPLPLSTPSGEPLSAAATHQDSVNTATGAGAEGAGVPPAVPASLAAAETAATAAAAAEPPAAADSPLEELRLVLQQARLAVARLEAEVTRLEKRLAALPAVAAAAAEPAAPVAEPAVAAATAAALRSLGLDASSASIAARQALREALQQVLLERGAAAAAGGIGGGFGAGGGRPAAAYPAGGGVAGAGMGEEEWFHRHFTVRSAARLAPPPPPPPPAAAAAMEEGAEAVAPAETPAAAAAVTCAFAYELPHPDAAAAGGGALQYIVAGDAAGTLYILGPADGAVLASLPTGTDSPVTACSAYYVRRYESTVVTGHANGQTRSFAVVLEEAEAAAAAGEGEAAAAPPPPPQRQVSGQRQRRQRDPRGAATPPSKLVVQSVRLRHVVESMPTGALPWAAVEELPMSLGGTALPAAAAAAAAGTATDEAAAVDAGQTPAAAAAAAAAGESDYKGPPAPIMHILPYRLSHRPTGRRHLLVLDRAGNLRMDRDNGTLRFWARTNRTQLAVRFVGSHVAMLSHHHATLMNTLQPRMPRAYLCHQLNGSRLLVASFDGQRPFRGYGINERGELLSLVTPHEGGLTTCKVHRATPLPWLDPGLLSDPVRRQQGLALTPLRGYLLLTHGSGRVLFNVTGVVRTGIPALTSVADEQIADAASAIASSTAAAAAAAAATASSGPSAAAATAGPGPSPLIGGMLPPAPVVAVGPGSQVVVLALPPPPPLVPATAAAEAGGGGGGGGGAAPLVVVLDSRMPRPAMSGGAGKVWSQPVFVVAMLLVGLYQFWRMSNTRMRHRAGPSASRGGRPRPGYGAGYGGNSYGDAAEYMNGEGRMPPLQPRSALRRGRSARPMGRTVTYEDDYY